MKRIIVYLFVSIFVTLSIIACEKEKTPVTTVDGFDYGNAYGKHLIQEVLVYPDGTKMEGHCKWDGSKIMNMYIKTDSSNVNISFGYNESRVSEITLRDGAYSEKYTLSYDGDCVKSVMYRSDRMVYGMELTYDSDVISNIWVYEGNRSISYQLTWDRGNLVKIANGSSYMEYQYDENHTQTLDIPLAYFLLGDVNSLVNLSVNNVVSVKTHNSEGDDSVSVSYNYTTDGFPTTAISSIGLVAYYQYADGDGCTYHGNVKDNVVSNHSHQQVSLYSGLLLPFNAKFTNSSF